MKFVSPTRRPPFVPQEDSWYSFLLASESNCNRTEWLALLIKGIN
jgi:hypothetical protein